MEAVPQLCSVQWGSSPLVADLGIPPFHVVEELVMHVVDRLGLGKEDLVVTAVTFERCAKLNRGLLRVCGVRRLFLGCCSRVRLERVKDPLCGRGDDDGSHCVSHRYDRRAFPCCCCCCFFLVVVVVVVVAGSL